MRDVVTNRTGEFFRQMENVHRWNQFNMGSMGKAKAEGEFRVLDVSTFSDQRVHHNRKSERQAFLSYQI